MIDIIGSIGGVVGCTLVSRGKALGANIVWSVSNLLMVVYFWDIGEMAAFTMFVVYELIAMYGIWNLTKQKRATHQKV